MSTFNKMSKDPKTGKYKLATWRDDFFGHHNYAVDFGNGEIYDPRFVDIKTREYTKKELLAFKEAEFDRNLRDFYKKNWIQRIIEYWFKP